MTTESLRATDALGAEGADAPRITLEYMTSQIAGCHYIDGQTLRRNAVWSDNFSKDEPVQGLGVVTVCMLVLKSGFVVIGMSSPMSVENFDSAKGRIFSYEQCVRQLWPLFAFAAKQGKVSP